MIRLTQMMNPHWTSARGAAERHISGCQAGHALPSQLCPMTKRRLNHHRWTSVQPSLKGAKPHLGC